MRIISVLRRTGRTILGCMRDRRGMAAVEMALVTPVLLAVTFGTVQYGMIMFTYNSMLTVARESTRTLSLGLATESAVRTTALSRLPAWVPPANWTISPQDTATTGTNQVRTTITVPSAVAAGFHMVPMPATLTVTVVMLKES